MILEENHGNHPYYCPLFARKTCIWEIDMEFVILSLMIISLLMVFTVDTVQKRRRYIGENN